METRCASSDVRPAAQGVAPGQALDRICRRLSREVGPQRFERYFGKQARLTVTDGCLDVTVPSRFMAELLDRRFGPALREAASAELTPEPGSDAAPQAPLRFSIESDSLAAAGAAPSAPPIAARRPTRKHARDGTSSARPYRLEDFVVGESNHLAYTAAVRLADGHDGQFRRIFIHGACGLGKTHLLYGVAARFKATNPGATILIVTGEAFTNEYITAVRENRLEAFRRRYRAVDLLCVDDVHFLSSKEKTQGELLHTFDALDLGGARLALASDGHPRDIDRLSEQLVSRFLAGAVVRLDAPDRDTRHRLIQAIARRRRLVLDDEAVQIVAERSGSGSGVTNGSVRELEGLLTQIEAVLRLLPEIAHQGRVGPAVVRRALGLDGAGSPSPNRAPRPIPMHVIIAEVCREFRVEHDAFTGNGRHKRVVMARSVCAYLARSLTTFSFPEIARHMGRPTHSTILAAAARVRARIDGADASKDLGPDLGPEFSGLGLREICDRLARDIRRASDRP